MTGAEVSSLVSYWQPRFRGELLVPAHREFSITRKIWNGMIDRSPAVIARCTSPQDVITAVQLARKEGLHVSVRGGGHGVAGTAVCEDGLMIDLSLMKQITVDPQGLEAVAEPGVLWGEFDLHCKQLHELPSDQHLWCPRIIGEEQRAHRQG